MALTTLARLKEFLGLKADDSTADAQLAQTIERISKGIATRCDRVFEFESAITEYHDGDGVQRTLLLRRAPVVTLTSLHDDVQRDYTSVHLIAATDYVVDKNAGLVQLDGFAFARGLQNIKVVYDAGYKVIPQDLEEACLALCAQAFWDLRGELRALAGEAVLERAGKVLERADETLERYRRVSF